jgi:hypothetical protein
MPAIVATNSATAATQARPVRTQSSPTQRPVGETFASRLNGGGGPHDGSPAMLLADKASTETAAVRAGDALDAEGERRRPALALADTDPLVRTLAQCAGPWVASGEIPTAAAADSISFAKLAPVEQILAQLVRRIAWSGDAKAGSARIELGSGELAGATLLVSAAAGVVHVSLELPPGADERVWRERIGQRLSLRGIDVGSLDVS